VLYNEQRHVGAFI